jgi:hypothetical protein
MTEPKREYWCIFCCRALLIDDGLIVHDDVPHDPLATYDEDEKPQ